jgi:copper resistance protein D
MDGPDSWIFFSLVPARAIQFLATVVGCGGMLFVLGILQPALGRGGTAPEPCQKLARRFSTLIRATLAVLVLSAFCVLALKSADISGAPLPEAVSADTLWTVLTETEFGNAWGARVLLLLLLLGVWARPTMRSSWWFDAIRLALAFSVAGALAWTGHANAGSGLQRSAHLGIDVLHLIAASAWVGALLPLAFVLRHASGGALPFDTARIVVLRFSNLGVLSVAVLVATGVLNTVMTVDAPLALVGSTYGRILLIKVSLFSVMVAFAAVNRQKLTRQLANSTHEAMAARALRRNCLIEAALGGIILALVGALGILPPSDGG